MRHLRRDKVVRKEVLMMHLLNAKAVRKEAPMKLRHSVIADPTEDLMKRLYNGRAGLAEIPTKLLCNAKAVRTVAQLTEVLPNPEAARLMPVLLREVLKEAREAVAVLRKEAAEGRDKI
jgi:hypothetical protein